MDNPPEHWDIAVLGTGLSQSILAAALAQGGKRVLHLDENAYYGGDSASLSLTEVVEWADSRSSASKTDSSSPSPSQYMSRQGSRFTSISYNFGDEELRKSLLKESRQYSISLMPTIIPATGDVISALVGSGVSRYGGFKLLEAVGVYDADHAGHIRRVPSSKEDVFKDRDMSLIEKRRLMKFLTFAAGQFEQADELRGQESTPFLDFLRTKFSLSVPVSNAIVFAIAHCSSPSDHSLSALNRMRRYLHATGRYGNSPFLIGHYGGAGEVAQGFCRAAAVKGATYILGRVVKSIAHIAQGPEANSIPPLSSEPVENLPTGPHYSIQLDGFANPVSADVIVMAPDYSPLVYPAGYDGTTTTSAPALTDGQVFVTRCIAILDRPVYATQSSPSHDLEGEHGQDASTTAAVSSGPDTSLVIFPPGSVGDGPEGPVFAFITGDGTLGCPSGKFIVYLTAIINRSGLALDPPPASQILAPYLERLLAIRDSTPSSTAPMTESAPPSPLFDIYYNQSLDHPPPRLQPHSVGDNNKIILLDESPSTESPLSESADKAAAEAEKVFWEVVGGKPRDGEDIVPGAISSFWQPLEETKDVDDDDPEW
ncbi:Rab proteins geranylgeranyltransferase component A [Tulasnella sp. JGI-2019a]|nr:Rab proteins geranylgeranyltransferase component A [Tulasnella sp. JGI-2019a]